MVPDGGEGDGAGRRRRRCSGRKADRGGLAFGRKIRMGDGRDRFSGHFVVGVHAPPSLRSTFGLGLSCFQFGGGQPVPLDSRRA